jgi:hypothetical protein
MHIIKSVQSPSVVELDAKKTRAPKVDKVATRNAVISLTGAIANV